MNEVPQTITPQTPPASPLAGPSAPVEPPQAPAEKRSPGGRKKLLGILLVVLLLLLGGGVAAYSTLVVVPNRPENVFKKALANFVSESADYTVTGRLDQGGHDEADFDYEIKTSGSDVYVAVDSSTFMMGPKVEVQRSGGKSYIRMSQFYDSAELARRYTNLGEKGLQEYMAEFTDKSDISANQDTWLEVNSYLLDQPAGNASNQEVGEADIRLVEVGEKEEADGKQIQHYKVSVSRAGLRSLIGKLDSSNILAAVFDRYAGTEGFPESIEASVQVDTNTKTLHKLTYNGRPFRDATLSLDLTTGPNDLEEPQGPLLTSKLAYGIVWSELFNPILQQGSTEADKERVADMKGIKTALEIYKARNGHYPDRYSMAVNQENTFPVLFPGADFAVFTDPAGRFIGRNGSQYAYVGETADGNQSCGPHNGPPCEKYFIVTTLDNGQEYQLNSD